MRRLMSLGTVGLGLVGCATAIRMEAPVDADASTTDGTTAGTTDGPTAGSGSGSGTPAPTTVPLLLSEVTLAPTGSEYIEIVNPTGFAVPLANLYLCDNGNYFKLPAGAPTLTSGDFLVKFPATDIIPAHGVITVAIGSSAVFHAAFGADPTYSIADANLTVVTAMTPSLTDSGEVVVLFQWDGTASVVHDVDIMIAGNPTIGNTLVSKSGYTQLTSAYKSDSNSIGAQLAAPSTGFSTKRIMGETGHETQTGGGNGYAGDDETSEATGTTWDATFSAPTPGVVPAALLQ
ncbi:hypothetical protein BH11MYX1_BH11MYX1_30350 [soil metagenome]